MLVWSSFKCHIFNEKKETKRHNTLMSVIPGLHQVLKTATETKNKTKQKSEQNPENKYLTNGAIFVLYCILYLSS